MPKIKTPKKTKKIKKTTNLIAIKPKTKKTTALTSAKKQELKKLITAYQQVGISLTKLFRPTK